MKKNPWFVLISLVVFFGIILSVLIYTSAKSIFGGSSANVSSGDSILKMKLEGVIMDSEKFLKNLRKYAENDHIKAIVIEINSPGGVVGPSQEINQEIYRIKEETKKPIIAVSTGIMASGAYYIAVAADQIVVQPGTLMGSIGVIMEFVNLEKLYDWAKIKRYSINTGKFKDSGAEYRSMRDDERKLFQDLVNDTWAQFKQAVAEGRGLDLAFVNQYADGRVITGAQGVKLGFADTIGTTYDAYEIAAEAAGLDDYDVFEPPKHKPSIFDLISGGDQEESIFKKDQLATAINQFLKSPLANKPLYLMPGASL